MTYFHPFGATVRDSIPLEYVISSPEKAKERQNDPKKSFPAT